MRLTYRVRPWQLAIVLLAILASPPASATWFSALETRRSPLESPREVVVVTSDLPEGITAADLAQAARDASAAWTSVACSSAELLFAGAVSDFADVGPSQTAVLFVSPSESRCFPDEENLGYTLITRCCDGMSSDGECDGRLFGPTTVLLNRETYRWSQEPAPYQIVAEGTPLTVDLPSVVTHELGHALGLHHDEVDSLATMRARYLLDGGLATLAARDKAGLCALYPREADECVRDENCPDLGSCVSIEEFQVCEEFRGEVGSYCALDELVCPGFCYLTSAHTYSGYCSTSCEVDADCPDGYGCTEDEAGTACVLLATPPESGCATSGPRAPAGAIVLLTCLLWGRRPRARPSRASSRDHSSARRARPC